MFRRRFQFGKADSCVPLSSSRIWKVHPHQILNPRPFTYIVAIFLFYRMRVMEWIFGSHWFLNIITIIFILFLLAKFILSLILKPSYGIIMYSASLLALYWRNSLFIQSFQESIPACRYYSYRITKNFRISEKVLLAILQVCLSFTCGLRGLIEAMIGIFIGKWVSRQISNNRLVMLFPSFLSSLLFVYPF